MMKHGTTVVCSGKMPLFCVLLFLVFCPSLSFATTIRAVTFQELLQHAEFVFEGRVIAVESVTQPDSHLPRTCFVFEISEVYKGSHPGDTVDLCFLGGVSGAYTVQVADMQYPELDEKGFYFVQSLEFQYANPFYGGKQGHFLIETDPDTSSEHVMTADRQPVTGITFEQAPPQALSTGVAGGVKTTDRLQMNKAWTVEDFRQNLRSMLEAMK